MEEHYLEDVLGLLGYVDQVASKYAVASPPPIPLNTPVRWLVGNESIIWFIDVYLLNCHSCGATPPVVTQERAAVAAAIETSFLTDDAFESLLDAVSAPEEKVDVRARLVDVQHVATGATALMVVRCLVAIAKG